MNTREFGKAISVSQLLLAPGGPDNLVLMSGTLADLLAKDYARSKFAYFPSWPGHPDIIFMDGVDAFKRDVQIAWYANVDSKYVIDTRSMV